MATDPYDLEPEARALPRGPRSAAERRQERRELIRQAWDEHYQALLAGEISLAEILQYDDEKLMKLADKGLRLFKLGKARRAIKVFRGLVVLDPWVPYFHYLLASAHEKLGNLDCAATEYGKAIEMVQELQPPPELLGYAVLSRGRVLARLGQVHQAASDLRRLTDGAIPINDTKIAGSAKLILDFLAHRPEAQPPG